MHAPFKNQAEALVHANATQAVLGERLRHLREKGWTCSHDDRHKHEELAAAAAFYLLPNYMDATVCTVGDDGEMSLQLLSDLIGTGAWEDIERHEDDPIDNLDMRIINVKVGLSLGLAELERLMRLRAKTAGAEARH